MKTGNPSQKDGQSIKKGKAGRKWYEYHLPDCPRQHSKMHNQDKDSSYQKKNPFIAGGLNMVMLGNAIQKIRGFSLPQGLCTASLLLVIIVPLFLIGQKTAHMHNSMKEQNTYYNTHRTPSKGSNDANLMKI